MSDKLRSGRFWMAMISAMVFAYMSATAMLDSKDVVFVIVLVFSYYFHRGDRDTPKPTGNA